MQVSNGIQRFALIVVQSSTADAKDNYPLSLSNQTLTKLAVAGYFLEVKCSTLFTMPGAVALIDSHPYNSADVPSDRRMVDGKTSQS